LIVDGDLEKEEGGQNVTTGKIKCDSEGGRGPEIKEFQKRGLGYRGGDISLGLKRGKVWFHTVGKEED